MSEVGIVLTEILIPFIVFTFFAVVIFMVIRANLQAKRLFLDVIEKLISNDKQVTPEAIQEIAKHTIASRKDLRKGSLLLAFSCGIYVAAEIIGFPSNGNLDLTSALQGLAVIPAFIGIAFLILHFVDQRHRSR